MERISQAAPPRIAATSRAIKMLDMSDQLFGPLRVMGTGLFVSLLLQGHKVTLRFLIGRHRWLIERIDRRGDLGRQTIGTLLHGQCPCLQHKLAVIGNGLELTAVSRCEFPRFNAFLNAANLSRGVCYCIFQADFYRQGRC